MASLGADYRLIARISPAAVVSLCERYPDVVPAIVRETAMSGVTVTPAWETERECDRLMRQRPGVDRAG